MFLTFCLHIIHFAVRQFAKSLDSLIQQFFAGITYIMYHTCVLKPTQWRNSRFMLVASATYNLRNMTRMILHVLVILSLEFLLSVQCFYSNDCFVKVLPLCLSSIVHQNPSWHWEALACQFVSLYLTLCLMRAPLPLTPSPDSSESNVTTLAPPAGASIVHSVRLAFWPGSVNSAPCFSPPTHPKSKKKRLELFWFLFLPMLPLRIRFLTP